MWLLLKMWLMEQYPMMTRTVAKMMNIYELMKFQPQTSATAGTQEATYEVIAENWNMFLCVTLHWTMSNMAIVITLWYQSTLLLFSCCNEIKLTIATCTLEGQIIASNSVQFFFLYAENMLINTITFKKIRSIDHKYHARTVLKSY